LSTSGVFGRLVGSKWIRKSFKNGKFMSDWDTPWEALTGHPRATGTHAKVLRLSREKNLMPLMTAISKMSYQYADFLAKHGVKQMEKKGRNPNPYLHLPLAFNLYELSTINNTLATINY
jgi:hypothetical protein